MSRSIIEFASRVWMLTKKPFKTKSERTESSEENIVKNLERYEHGFIKVQRILIWENPVISFLSLVFVNILFWLLIVFEIRFYGLVFTVLLIYFVYNVWHDVIWPEISVPQESPDPQDWTPLHPRVFSAPEIGHYVFKAQSFIQEYYKSLKNCRREHPGTFCCAMSVIFFMLSVLGRSVSGMTIAYVIVMLIMTVPGACVNFFPENFINVVSKAPSILPDSKDLDSDVDEYLPEQTGENMAMLSLALNPEPDDEEDSNQASTEFVLESADSSPSGPTSSLTTGQFMPSLEASLDSIGEFELSRHKTKLLDPDNSDSDSENNELAINFRSTHFNGDESSSEDSVDFAQGLTSVPDPEPLPGIGELVRNTAMKAVSNFGQSLISSVLSSNPTTEVAAPTSRRRDSSSSNGSEDFEMVSKDELHS